MILMSVTYTTELVKYRVPVRHGVWNFESIYRVIHKSLRNFRTRLRNNQDRHERKEHINRYRISQSFFCTKGLGVLAGSTARG